MWIWEQEFNKSHFLRMCCCYSWTPIDQKITNGLS
jgi:hypothetical protein